MKKLAIVVGLLLLVPSLAWGQQVNVNKAKQNAGNTITNGSPSATAGSSAVGVGSVTTNTSAGAVSGSTSGVKSNIQNGNTNTNESYSGSNPYQGTSINTNFDRYAPSVSPPALTAAGTGVCLGSISGSLMGPMAGIGFGTTKVDQGCERRSGAALLFNMGHKGAALRVLAGESIQDALAAEGIAPKPVAKAPTMDQVIGAQLATPQVKATTVSADQIFAEPLSAASSVQGN